jgi:hypothetical protein
MLERATRGAGAKTRRATWIAVGALTLCASLAPADGVRAQEALTTAARFTPDRPGAPTNLSLTASFLSSAGSRPSPITKFMLYAPAGMNIDLRGAGVCAQQTLQQLGPSACPADSRAGFGGGVGALYLPTETIHEPYTLDFFFATKRRGHLRLLIYTSALAPVGAELVLVARQVPAPKPYGLGFSVEVPPISTFPDAADASIESAFLTVGAPNVAYYEPVHGRRTLVHLRGLIVPRSCPPGGFPTEGVADFADGAALTVKSAIPCPRRP